ncbi:unnamed protein product [Rhizophagus irregularis]|nr:unnamed protein product [Rhizophagus irregularis]
MEHISHKRLQSFIENEGKREDKGVGLGLWVGLGVGWECGLGVWVGSVGWECGLGVWVGSVGWECGLGVWVESVGWECGLGVWVGSVGWECGLGVWVGSVGWECGLGVLVGVWVLESNFDHAFVVAENSCTIRSLLLGLFSLHLSLGLISLLLKTPVPFKNVRKSSLRPLFFTCWFGCGLGVWVGV